MNETHQLWIKAHDGRNYDLSPREFVDTLDFKHKFAFLVDSLDIRVCNGGFNGWNYNGDAEFSSELLDMLKPYVSNEIILLGYLMIQKAHNLLNQYSDVKVGFSEVVFGTNSELRDSRKEEFYERREELQSALFDLDLMYYDAREKFMEEMDKVFAAMK